jgi:hypothetical protein
VARCASAHRAAVVGTAGGPPASSSSSAAVERRGAFGEPSALLLKDTLELRDARFECVACAMTLPISDSEVRRAELRGGAAGSSASIVATPSTSGSEGRRLCTSLGPRDCGKETLWLVFASSSLLDTVLPRLTLPLFSPSDGAMRALGAMQRTAKLLRRSCKFALASIRISDRWLGEEAAAAAAEADDAGAAAVSVAARMEPHHGLHGLHNNQELRNSLHRRQSDGLHSTWRERLPVASGERAPIVYTKSASGERLPPHAYAARALYDHVGDEAVGTLSAAAGTLVLVQGDRAYEEPAGWMYCCSCGAIGLLPAAFLAPASTVGPIPARAVFSFDAQGPAFAGDQQELSFAKGQLLSLMPTEADPVGWVTAVLGGARGIVPQNYVQPEVKPAPPSAPAPTAAAVRADAERRAARRVPEAAPAPAPAPAPSAALQMRRRSPGDAAYGRSKLRARGGGAYAAAAADPRPILAPVPLACSARTCARHSCASLACRALAMRQPSWKI